MGLIKKNNVVFEVDDQGYLANSSAWNLQVALAIAQDEGIQELSLRHLVVIDFVRRDFALRGSSPNVYRISKESGVKTAELYALFPGAPAKKAARIAGAKKPASCV